MIGNDKLKILALRKAGKFPDGEFHHVGVYHDDWCQTLVQFGECDCDPDIVIDEVPQDRLFTEVAIFPKRETT